MNADIHSKEIAVQRFWRDEALPFVEAREVLDGRGVCYAKHAHQTFSIGVVTGGQCTYLNEKALQPIGAGAVVVVNPESVHACNPIDGQPWSYRMLYVDTAWLAGLQHDLNFSEGDGFLAFSATMTTQPDLYRDLNRFYAVLTDESTSHMQKESAAIGFFSDVQHALGTAEPIEAGRNEKLDRVAQYIRAHCTQPLTLQEICAAGDLSASYLIRAFKQRYGMTPHAYQTNCRIEYSRSQLKRGRAIADVAIEAGFADQAHLQRVFKQFMAATPGQYRR